MRYIKLPLILIIALFTIQGFAQEEEPTPVKDLSNGSVEEQFDYVISNSNRFQEYKVIKRKWIDKLEANVTDSLDEFRDELATVNNLIDEQENEISTLKAALDTAKNSVQSLNTEKDNINFFAVSMSKATYKSIMWGIIGVLSLLLIIFIGRFASSKRVTAQTKKAHNEVQEAFDAYKAKAMEDEQKLRRKLQDEINKRIP